MRKAVLSAVILILCMVFAGPVFAQRNRERRPPSSGGNHGRAVPRTQPRTEVRPQAPPRSYRSEPRLNFRFDWGYPYSYYRGYYPPYYSYPNSRLVWVPGQWVYDYYVRDYIWVPAHYERIW